LTVSGQLTAGGLSYPTSDGTNEQVLRTDGSGNLSFGTISGTTINNNADNRIITGSGTTNTLEGETTLTYDGNTLTADYDLSGFGKSIVLKNTNNSSIYSRGSAIGFEVSNGSATKDAAFIKGGRESTTSGGYLYFETADSSWNTPAEAMRIDSSGNVGIGTSSPTAYTGYATLALNGTNGGILEFKKGDTQMSYIANAGDPQLQFVTNGSERMRIDSAGNVGIGDGTISPTSMLHIYKSLATADLALQSAGASGRKHILQSKTDGSLAFYDNNASSERMRINSNGNVEIAEELILDSVGQSEWGMVKLDSQQLSGTYSQVEISISPSYSGYSVYKMIINRFQLAADGELWCNYMYGTTKKGGWFGGYSRAGEGNSVGQEGYSNQPQCEIVGTNTTATQNNSYPFVGEFTFYPLESGNRGKIVWSGLGRLSSGLSQSIFGAALTINTNAPDKIVFYSNQNISKFDYVLYGIKV